MFTVDGSSPVTLFLSTDENVSSLTWIHFILCTLLSESACHANCK
uniref:Uncharacterized protein n=1 Tax=Arundo donax TaxID=35708 RepID=A0A0A9H8L1_ARUDO